MFSKQEKTVAPPRPANNIMATSSNSFSVLGTDLKITGDIHASEDLHIDGSVEGDIDCASLVQGEQSEISGAIKSDNARLAGSVTGSITVKTLVILKTARIAGDVFYDTLTIEQGASVEGKFAQRAQGAAVPSTATKAIASDKDDGEAMLSLAN